MRTGNPRLKSPPKTKTNQNTMKTHDRIDTGVREYIPMHQNKTAAEIQADIDLMRLAYASRMNQNQPRRDRMVGWSLLIVGVFFPIIAVLVFILE